MAKILIIIQNKEILSKRLLYKIPFFLPNLQQCWIIVGILIVAGTLLSSGILLIIALLKGIAISELILSINGLVSYLLPFIPVVIFLHFIGNYSAKVSGRKEPINRPDIGGANPLFFISAIFMLTFSTGFLIDPLSLLIQVPDNLKAALETQLNSVSGIVAIAVAAPLCEEFLIRGIMTRGMLTHYKPAKAIIWGAFFFALIHMNLWQGVSAFIIGVLLGWIYYKTHSIWTVVFIHFINNGSSALLYNLFPNNGMDISYIKIMPTELYIICYIAAIMLTAALIFYLQKTLPKKNLFATVPKLQIENTDNY